MKKCCDNCGNCVPLNPFIPICEECVFVQTESGKIPSNWKPLPQTNADRIRAMSDEELCEFLSQYKFCDICEEGCDNCKYHGDCDKRLLEWLKQPAEGD